MDFVDGAAVTPIFAILIAGLILFFPSGIAPDPSELHTRLEPARQKTTDKKRASNLTAAMNLKKIAPFERERFLKSFERQTTQALIDCLKVSLGEKGSVEFISRLHANGQLTAVRSTNATSAQISCAVPMIEQMRFPTGLSPDLMKKSGEGIEIEWRLDW